MAIRDIIKDPDPLLRKKSREVTDFNERLAKLLDDMRETMKQADGVGLAAPQVGILRRAVIVTLEDEEVLELINPKIVESSGELADEESCLSVERRRCTVMRPSHMVIDYCERDGKKVRRTFEGYDVRVCCHEMDHLEGVLFYDRCVDTADNPSEESPLPQSK